MPNGKTLLSHFPDTPIRNTRVEVYNGLIFTALAPLALPPTLPEIILEHR